MGLRNADTLLPMAVITGFALVLGAFADAGRELLAYSRPEIATGEFWRLLSGHVVHLSWAHLALNLLGLWLVWYLVARAYKVGGWLLIAIVVVIGIDLGFWFLQPQLEWYVGLSGILHGFLAAGIVAGLAARSIESWILAAVLASKIIYEQGVGPLPGSEYSTGGTVIVVAHLYGAISGTIVAIALQIRVRARPSI